MVEWFAAQVWVRREHITVRHLQMRGYETFLPVFHERRRWSDRVKMIERALFPGYIFYRRDREVAEKVVTAPGVVRIVGDSSGPAPIPAVEIDAIRRIAESKVAREPWPFLRAGQKVRIERGPLRGIEGMVVTVSSRRRLIVSVQLLQRSIAVDIEPEAVDVVDFPEAVS